MTPSTDTARLALDTILHRPGRRVPSWMLHAMEHALIERLAGAAPGEFRRDPERVFLACQRAAGTIEGGTMRTWTLVCAGAGLILAAGLAGRGKAAPLESAAPAVMQPVPLPPGETPIEDIGTYQVCYQSYGGPVVKMPPSWMGHFTTESGISYLPGQRILGRSALLLHSPWRVPPGKVWADYPLALPKAGPIVLSFGIAMAPDVVAPDKSDGVTFSCYLVADGQTRELMRQNMNEAKWHDFRFDLSPYAGKTITLRLQTEPGPKNDPSFDYSYFGGAKIAVGTAKENRAELVRRLTSTPAYKATESADLTALSNTPALGIVPSNLLQCWNVVEEKGNTYRFRYAAKDGQIVYTYTPATGTLDDFTVAMDGGRPFKPAIGGGATIEVKRDGKTESLALRGGKALDITKGPDSLKVRWEYPAAGQPVQLDWTFRIFGKALTISVSCDQPVVSSFSLGDVGMAPLRKPLAVPYLYGTVSYLPVQNVFVCRYLDWTQSHSSQCPQGAATYEPKTDGTRNRLMESGYVAVSPDVDEVLPNLPHPPSPYLSLLGPRVMLDIWGHHKGTYEGDAENLRDLKDNGVDHVAIISHVWQRYGYDVKLPDHLPANPAFGGDAGMVEFGKAANECGYVWSLHENYIDLYPDAPSYDPTARVLRADGSPSPAWFNKGTGVQSFGLKCNRALGYAKQNSPEIHRRFGTTAGYLDVHTCVPPWHQLDHDATQPMAAMELSKVKNDTALFQFMRDTHGGPLFGEGHYQFYWAGRCDGVEAQVDGGEGHAPFLDFDLLKLHPQMVNHGMGYYERWFSRGYEHRWGHDSGTPEQVDKYRAQELAYGHAGFIGAAQTDNVQWVAKEHHLMHAVQRLYGTAKPKEIRYEVEGKMVTASVALVAGDTTRQRIRYDSGLTLWINWRPEPWQVQGRTLPQWGFLALGPDTEVCTSLRNGKISDYADCPEYLFADARTSFNMPYLHPDKDIEPKLKSLKYLGGSRVQLTYEWVVNDTLDQDYNCFVHFTNPANAKSDHIDGQQDHALPKPTSQWRKGETVVDGPYEVELPATRDYLEIAVGLYKGDRVSLKGPRDDTGRILLGRLNIKRDGGRITDVTLAPAQGVVPAAREADFTAHMNPAGTWVDFGKVATDGSVKINKAKDGLVLFPYPREKRFRVSLDLKALAPTADPARVTVRALAARTQADLGKAEYKIANGRLELTVGTPGAGRYAVKW